MEWFKPRFPKALLRRCRVTALLKAVLYRDPPAPAPGPAPAPSPGLSPSDQEALSPAEEPAAAPTPGMAPTQGVPGFTATTETNPGFTGWSAPGELGPNTGWTAPAAATGYTTNTALSGIPGWATDFGDPSLPAATAAQGEPAFAGLDTPAPGTAPAPGTQAPAAVTAQPSADIGGRSPATVADVVDAMTQANKTQTFDNPITVTPTTPNSDTSADYYADNSAQLRHPRPHPACRLLPRLPQRKL